MFTRLGQRLLVVHVDGEGVALDESLWVRMVGVDEIGYIEGNARLVRGRVRVHFPESGACEALVEPRAELEEMSPLAEAWLDGFLAGAEPSVQEYLGVDSTYDATDEEWARYEGFCVRCRRRGSFPDLPRRPARPVHVTDAELLDLRVPVEQLWAYSGERVWRSHPRGWEEVPAEKGLEDEGWLIGSVCLERGHHNLSSLASEWLVCVDCGLFHDERGQG